MKKIYYGYCGYCGESLENGCGCERETEEGGLKMELYYYDYMLDELYEIESSEIGENDILWYHDDKISLYAACECDRYKILVILTADLGRGLQRAVNGICESCDEFSELYNPCY